MIHSNLSAPWLAFCIGELCSRSRTANNPSDAEKGDRVIAVQNSLVGI